MLTRRPPKKFLRRRQLQKESSPRLNKRERWRLRNAMLSPESDEGQSSQLSFGAPHHHQSRSMPIYTCNLEDRYIHSNGRAASGASLPSRLFKTLCCFLVKPNRDDTKPSRKPNVPIAQAEGDDAAIDRASASFPGECLRGAAED